MVSASKRALTGMKIKSFKGQVYGADLTEKERKAMNMEIQRQLAEYDKKHEIEMEAIVLWELHEQLGFGAERLKRFYNNFAPSVQALIDRYELEDEDKIWLCTHKLKEELNIDLETWKGEV